MTGEWRKRLTFAIKLDAITEMHVTLKSANRQWSDSEALKHARSFEVTARKAATSINEYHALIADKIQRLRDDCEAMGKDDHFSKESKAQDVPPSGISIGQYNYAQHYKEGAFSEIFRAVSPKNFASVGEANIVALKVTSPSTTTAPHDPLREARLLAQAQSNHIIRLIETFNQSGGRFVMVFPFMPCDLNHLLRSTTPVRAICRIIVRDMFAGLRYLHGLGIIHRDIKPSNILLASPSGPAYLADLGIAWSPTDSASEPAHEKFLDVGTTCYRPPELLFGKQAYGRSLDLWAIGCVVAQIGCLGSQTLFDAGDLGSELALIKSIFETLGTPNEGIWPETRTLPDWGKMNFKQYPSKTWTEILPGADPDAVDFISHLVVYESSQRMQSIDALNHAYLQ